MTNKKFNFDLGNRSLTANETMAVEAAKRVFRNSLEKHLGKTVAGNVVFKATANAKAAEKAARPRVPDVADDKVAQRPRGTDVVHDVTTSWTTNKSAPGFRKY